MPTLLQTAPMSESESPRSSLVFAYYVTGHGFGHATRVVEVVRHLISSGHRVHVVSAAPEFVFTKEIHSPNLFIRNVLLDSGSVQSDALTVDRRASLEKYCEIAVEPRDSILATEVEWLKSIKANLVVSDVVPIACRAAANAGIRSVCVTNFSWDFIYAEYVMAYILSPIHRLAAEDYSHCEFLIRLPGYCPMPAFHDVINIPLVVRPLHKSREQVRRELGVPDNVKLLIFNFGGQEDIVVARAPGRLDVMGGIADYSGSLVLLRPTREACHAAVQRNHPSKQKLWKHAEARPHSRDTPILEIVSFGSELSNRGPTFDMDLTDFMEEDGKPNAESEGG